MTLLTFTAESCAAARRAAGRPAAAAVDLLHAGPTASNPSQRRAAAE